jgi:WXG100 family type VII secretion target
VGFLKVDYAGAEQIAATLKQNAEARLSDINTLSGQVDPSAVWEGAAATAYQEKYEQWKSAENNLVNALEQLGGVVKQIVDNFDQIDQQGAGALH